jgi:Flp pilus assembly protein TadD
MVRSTVLWPFASAPRDRADSVQCISSNTAPRGIPARSARSAARVLVAAATLVLGGCLTLGDDTVFQTLDDDATYRLLVLESRHGMVPDEDILAVSPDMRELAAGVVRENSSRRQRLAVLAELFTEGRGLELDYDPLGTYTAAETLDLRAGNCLAYTHLFVAVAREVGLDARYREVRGITRWDEVGEFVLVNRHVGAFGEIPRYGTYHADFGLLNWGEDRFGGLISDDRARALHFNNLGARSLTGGDSITAVRQLNRALVIDRGLSYIWANLGTAYMRLGEPALAEKAYRQALRLDIYDSTAINQLVRLYESLGEERLAERYRERAQRVARQNPYRQYYEAMDAIEEGNLDQAIALLRRAAQTQPNELQFQLQLGVALALRGHERSARDRFTRAARLAEHIDDERLIIDAMMRLETLAAERREKRRRAFSDDIELGLPPRPVP